MQIVYKTEGKVLRQEPGSTKIYIPRLIAEEMKLSHKEVLTLTLTETGQLIIEKAKENLK